jgi:hypothetical protein
MRKGQKRTPLPAPALTEKDLAHLNWIRRNSAQLVRSALKLIAGVDAAPLSSEKKRRNRPGPPRAT